MNIHVNRQFSCKIITSTYRVMTESMSYDNGTTVTLRIYQYNANYVVWVRDRGY